MSKQDKIEAAKANKNSSAAVKASVAALGQINTSAFDNVPTSDRYWQISGTSYFSRNKEDLKGLRRALNIRAGVNEGVAEVVKHDDNDKEIVVDKIAATPAKDWPFKITKGPAHPRLNG